MDMSTGYDQHYFLLMRKLPDTGGFPQFPEDLPHLLWYQPQSVLLASGDPATDLSFDGLYGEFRSVFNYDEHKNNAR